MSQLSRIVLIIAMNVLVYVLAVERYSDKYDNVIDIDAVLNNDTLREEFHNCYMKTAPCTKAQKDITDQFDEAVITNCEKCTETQKEWLKKIVKWYAKNQIEKLLQKLERSAKNMKQKNAN